MPIYDYDCVACGRRIEVVHGVYAPGPTHCPNCGEGPLRKAIAAPAVHFKGSGWAKRDRRAAVTAGAPKVATDAAAVASGESGDGNAPKEGDAAKDSGGASDAGGTKDGRGTDGSGTKDRGGAADESNSGHATRTDDVAGDRAAARSRKTGAGTATRTD